MAPRRRRDRLVAPGTIYPIAGIAEQRRIMIPSRMSGANGHVLARPKANHITDGPRKRLHDCGPEALSDAELLSLVLGTGHRAAGDAHSLSRTLLARFGTLQRTVSAAGADLARHPGVGAARAAALRAIGELARRLASTRLERGMQIRSPHDVHAHFGPLLAQEKKERFCAILLDGKNRVMSHLRISEGSLGASLVHPREAFRPAIREAAAAVIFLHNHPSGDPTPSSEDRQVTGRLRDAGELLGIPVLDHVIVAADGYYSFADDGR